ncbi:hypothetical protein [Acidithiobacillus marinus]|nr:hypothetical protein [Acidithiobacillus marinus]
MRKTTAHIRPLEKVGLHFVGGWMTNTTKLMWAHPGRVIIATTMAAIAIFSSSPWMGLFFSIPVFITGLPKARNLRTKAIGILIVSSAILVSLYTLSMALQTAPWAWMTPNFSLKALVILALWAPIGSTPMIPLFTIPGLLEGQSLKESIETGWRFFRTGFCQPNHPDANNLKSGQQRFAILLAYAWVTMFMGLSILLLIFRIPQAEVVAFLNLPLIVSAPYFVTVVRNSME